MNELTTMSIVTNTAVMDSMMRLASEMAKSTISVPKHLIGKPSDCLAIAMQAAQWGMNPFTVAQKTHLVNGVLGYESQLVNAIAQSSGAVRGRFHFEYTGEGNALKCRAGAVLNGEDEMTWGEWLGIAQITTQNSPLWKTNPRQQMAYLQTKNWCRLYCPGAILGVYSADELETIPTATRVEKEINPIQEKSALDVVIDYIANSGTKEHLLQVDTSALTADEKAVAKEAYKARALELSVAKANISDTAPIEQSWDDRLRGAKTKAELDAIISIMDDVEIFEHNALIEECMDMFS